MSRNEDCDHLSVTGGAARPYLAFCLERTQRERLLDGNPSIVYNSMHCSPLRCRAMSATRRLTITLDAEDYGRLARLAKFEDRSLSWTVGRAVKEYLRRYPVSEQLPLNDDARERHHQSRS